MSSAKNVAESRPAPAWGLPRRLTGAEGEALLRIVSDSQAIQRHRDLFLWMRGELQQFIPHDIFIAASGDFATWQMKLDVVSALPDVRTAQLARCGNIDELVEELHAQWVAGGRQPLVLSAADCRPLVARCTCPLHDALRTMRTLLVHGMRDLREGYDSLYLAFSRSLSDQQLQKENFLPLLELFVSQIDIAFRRVPPFSVLTMNGHTPTGAEKLHLSAREQEILDWICRGKTNIDIATALDISPFTVKNHLQRIFRKIGVSNRTEAATKYNQALRQLRAQFTR